MFDVIIIGAGVIGSACARELSRYQLHIAVMEKEEDVCSQTSKANSGIVHAGYDAKEGSLMAKLNVEGNKLMGDLSKALDFSFERRGSFVVCTEKEKVQDLAVLLERGKKNGVEGLEIITDRNKIFEMEPNITEEVCAVLYAPSAGIVCPFGLNIALAENANENGVSFYFQTQVLQIEKKEGFFLIHTNKGIWESKCIVNAAGVYADIFHNMVSENKIEIVPRRGEYYLLDKNVGTHVSRTIFALPGKLGKGILVTPTVHGNILVGPTAEDIENKEDVATTFEKLEEIKSKANMHVKGLNVREVITSFSGLRAHENGHEFIVEEVADARGFIDCAGMESPGLTSAPAVGKMVESIVVRMLKPVEKKYFKETRKGMINPSLLSMEERNQLIKENPSYGTIVCRCEMISEGEILDAIKRPLGAQSLDGIKRRARAGAGRCQGGFCSPKVMELVQKTKGIRIEEVRKSNRGSEYIKE